MTRPEGVTVQRAIDLLTDQAVHRRQAAETVELALNLGKALRHRPSTHPAVIPTAVTLAIVALAQTEDEGRNQYLARIVDALETAPPLPAWFRDLILGRDTAPPPPEAQA